MSVKGETHSNVGFDELSFEEAILKLNQTVESLEVGELSISEATLLYETGINLVRVCNQKLAEAELKITQIQTEYGNQIQLSTTNNLEE